MQEESLKGYQDLLHYYENLKIVPENDFPVFSKILLQDLPPTFRINKTRFFWEKTKEKFEKAALEIEAESQVKVLKKIILRDQEAYQVLLDSLQLRKDKRFSKLSALLREENELSNIFRQELVSMIPVTFLDITHGHRVLDMCAAPGSKTLQILERMQLTKEQDKAEEVLGCVVANELDAKRANMLAFQALKMAQNYAMIINHDITTLPDTIKFDRILCDVPCSGDGTIRKNEMIKKGWYPKFGQKLHPQQLKILLKGLNMLTEGGLLVYSTCSMNPIEDEAVVSAALDCMGGAVELVDLRDKFGNFKIQQGISKWKVYLKRGRKELNLDWFETYQEAVDVKRHRRLVPTMFPNEKAGHPLHYTARILPHENNTGGFYIALFKKKEEKVYDINLIEDIEIEEEAKVEETKMEETKTDNNQGHKEEEEKVTSRTNSLAPFEEKMKDVYEGFKNFYGLKGSNLKLYMLNDHKRRVLNLNRGLVKFIEESSQETLRIVNIGQRALERLNDDVCATKFRVSFEFLPAIFQYIENQKIAVDLNMFKELLEDFQGNLGKLPLENIQYGPFLIYVENTRNLVLIGWKGKRNNNIHVAKEDIIFLKYLTRNQYYL